MIGRILYVEDNPQNMRLVRNMLNTAGYEMLEATDGLTGVAVAAHELPDLILMDMHLPDINGLEATACLKASPQLSWIPVIALTANPLQGDRENCIAACCDGYIPKPITRNELLSTVSFFLETTQEQAKAS